MGDNESQQGQLMQDMDVEDQRMENSDQGQLTQDIEDQRMETSKPQLMEEVGIEDQRVEDSEPQQGQLMQEVDIEDHAKSLPQVFPALKGPNNNGDHDDNDAVEDEEDLDEEIMDAEDLQRVREVMNKAEFAHAVEFDLTREYIKPSLEVALANRRYYMPSKENGEQYSIWGTKAGRFVNKHGSCLDCLGEGRKSELIAFGSGVSAYFKLIKAMSILFGLLVLMAVPLLAINVREGTYFQHHPVPLTATTLGNLFPGVVLPNGTIVIPATPRLSVFGIQICQQDLDNNGTSVYNSSNGGDPCQGQDVMLFYCVWDAIMMLAFYLAINVFHNFTTRENQVYKRKIPKVEDYSVQISVPLGADAQSIQQHFETPGMFQNAVKVFDVQVVENTGSSISICVQRGLLLKKHARLDAAKKLLAMDKNPSVKTAKQVASNETRIQHVVGKITKLDERAKTRVDHQQGKRALMAFVTFETQEQKLRVLDEYENDKSCRCCCVGGRQSKWLRFRGKQPVWVKPAPPPSTLLWENQEDKHSCLRVFTAILLFAAILVVTAALSYMTDQNRVITNALGSFGDTSSDPPGTEFCSGRYANLTSIADQLEEIQLGLDQGCFCDDRFNNHLTNPTPTELDAITTLCDAHAAEVAAAIGKQVGFSILVILINIIIYKVIMLVSVHLIKFRNILSREIAIMRVIFIITFINTAIIVLLVNSDWGTLTGMPFVELVGTDGTVFVRSGDFVDFEPDWYSKVGVEIFILSVLNIVGPYLLPATRYVVHLLEQRFAAKHAVSQQALNDLFLGEEFLLSVRLAQMLTMVFFTLAFSSGIPLLYVSCFAAFMVAYWFDKFFFLRLARTPPQFDTMLQQWALRTLEWAVVLHCLLGFWMHSSPRTFPNVDHSGFRFFDFNISELPPDMSDQIQAQMQFTYEFSLRLTRPGPIALLAMGALVVAVKIARRSGKACWCCLRSMCGCLFNMCTVMCRSKHPNTKLSKAVLQADSFDVLLAKGWIAGVSSYNILANPVYQTMFQMQRNRRVDFEGGGFDDVESVVSSGTNRPLNEFHSLQDTLNIRKETAVSSIHEYSSRPLARSLDSATSSPVLPKPSQESIPSQGGGQ
ncbi:hypothetical protein BASA81_004725 [Batrachochytrium salamandrivorans]|nr:hypothetical protein BASA81_004725 [Batrachochytrium salamandrivorans]